MIPYGLTKRHYKLHPHNQCSICAENKISRKRERQISKKWEKIAKELGDEVDKSEKLDWKDKNIIINESSI